MEMFGHIKGIYNAEEMLFEKLWEVGLIEVAYAKVGTYSGGMKWRLSVAISCIGNPWILFMDEPTTGMDPLSWQ